MKKRLFLSLLAALMMALGVEAQENTYNMVIKMADGTSLTIGPNEIENIAFNDGAVVVSGTKIDEMMRAINECKADIQWNRDMIKHSIDQFNTEVKGNVLIVDPETGNPYYSTMWYGDVPLTMERLVYMPQINDERIKQLEYRVSQQEDVIKNLAQKLSELEGRLSNQ